MQKRRSSSSSCCSPRHHRPIRSATVLPSENSRLSNLDIAASFVAQFGISSCTGTKPGKRRVQFGQGLSEMNIDAKDFEKLRKIQALITSPEPGEAAAARDRAEAILAKYEIGPDDLSKLDGLTVESVKSANTTARNPFAGYDEWAEKQEPGYKARVRAERAEEERERAAYRAAVISKYGSEEAAKSPVQFEQVVEDAVAHLKRREMKHYANGDFETLTLDGWSHGDSPVPDSVLRAVEGATPLPTTIAGAKAEYDLWCERERELGAAWNSEFSDNYLSIACILRQDIVRDLMETGLRAQTLNDVIIRQRYVIQDYMADGFCAVLADLEHLAGMAPAAAPSPEPAPVLPAQTGRPHKTAADRNHEVTVMLVNPSTGDLSDREIARRVGVSPQTVGNIRRRIANPSPMAF